MLSFRVYRFRIWQADLRNCHLFYLRKHRKPLRTLYLPQRKLSAGQPRTLINAGRDSRMFLAFLVNRKGHSKTASFASWPLCFTMAPSHPTFRLLVMDGWNGWWVNPNSWPCWPLHSFRKWLHLVDSNFSHKNHRGLTVWQHLFTQIDLQVMQRIPCSTPRPTQDRGLVLDELIHQLGALKDIDDVLPALNENVLLAMAPDPGKFGKHLSDIFKTMLRT